MRQIIFQYFIDSNKIELKDKNFWLDFMRFLNKNKKLSSLSIFEILGIIDILLNFGDNDTFFEFKNLIINIKYDNNNDKLLEYFSTINFDKIFVNINFDKIFGNDYFFEFIYELIFILINKLEKYLDNYSEKEDIKNNEKLYKKYIRIRDELKEEIINIIMEFQEKFCTFLEKKKKIKK